MEKPERPVMLSESLKMSMDAVPEGVDTEEIISEMKEVQGVSDVHHVHIWPISTTQTALTAHVVLSHEAVPEDLVAALKKHLAEHGIGHATIETEREGRACTDHDCC